MTRKAMLLVTGFTVALATAAYAATGDGFGPGGGMRGGMHKMGMHGGGMHGMRLKALDTDNDGDVTLAEFLKTSDARWTELDKDNAGVLDAAKLTAAFKARSDERTDKMLQRLDRDRDGKVSLAEFLDAGKRGHKGWGRHGRQGHHGMRMGAGPDQDGMEPGMGQGRGQGRAQDRAQDRAAQAEQGGAEAGAEQGDRGPRRGWGGRHQGRMAGRMGSTETRIERFKAMDKNGDGFVDKSEMQAATAEDIAYRVKRMMHTLDANKDGRITRDEFLAPAKQRFARMDLNDDGRITADDLPPRMRQRWASK